MKDLKTIDWEGITWTRVRTDDAAWRAGVDGPACEGCENRQDAVEVYTALDPEGWRIYTHWCTDCISIALGEMAFKEANK